MFVHILFKKGASKEVGSDIDNTQGSTGKFDPHGT